MSSPVVSVIVPCLNEQATIGELIDALATQDFPEPVEVIIADGMSEDATRTRIADAHARHADLDVRVIDNLERNIPAGLNRALDHARGEFIVRIDAHCLPAASYISRSIAGLRDGLGDCVGGVIDVAAENPRQPMARGIAYAVAHPIGVGDASYRFARTASEVDTVPFGAFRRELLERLGGYDDRLLANQDYELNARIRKEGGRVWLDPEIRSIYYPRASLGSLSRQYRRYGLWKMRMLRLGHMDTLRWRQALPPLFVASLAGLTLVAPFSRLARRALAVQVGSYFAVLGVAGLRTAKDKGDPLAAISLPSAVAVMHSSWGFGFLKALILERGGGENT